MKSLLKTRYMIASLGILTALVIVLMQVFCFELSDDLIQKVDTEQQSESSDKNHDHFISLPASCSFPSSASLLLNQEFTFIEEFILGSEETEVNPVTVQLANGRLFKALFSFIISPNAP
jgi:hypothetical protein